MSVLKTTTNYANTYEKVRNELQSNPFYSDKLFNKYYSQDDLPFYVKTLSDSGKINMDNLKNDYKGFDFADDNLKWNILTNELYADKDIYRRDQTGNIVYSTIGENSKPTLKDDIKREYYEYDENGNVKLDEDDLPITKVKEMSDYEYNKYEITNQLKRAEYNYQMQIMQENKKGSLILSTLTNIGELTLSFTKSIKSLINFVDAAAWSVGGLINGKYKNVEEFSKDFIEELNLVNKDFIGKGLKNVTNWLADFESKYTHIRTYNGDLTWYGKITNGLAESAGQMLSAATLGSGIDSFVSKLPSSFTFKSASSIINSKLPSFITKSLPNTTSIVFYTSIASNDILETYRAIGKTEAPPSASSIIANSTIKSFAQYSVEILLGELLGGASGLDNLVFGRETKNIASKTFTRTALKTISKDALQEGLEEVLQDTSDALINVFFDKLGAGSFTSLNEGFSAQSLMESFVMGSLMSLGGNAISLVKTNLKWDSTQYKDLTVNNKPLNAIAKYGFIQSIESYAEQMNEISSLVHKSLLKNNIYTDMEISDIIDSDNKIILYDDIELSTLSEQELNNLKNVSENVKKGIESGELKSIKLPRKEAVDKYQYLKGITDKYAQGYEGNIRKLIVDELNKIVKNNLNNKGHLKGLGLTIDSYNKLLENGNYREILKHFEKSLTNEQKQMFTDLIDNLQYQDINVFTDLLNLINDEKLSKKERDDYEKVFKELYSSFSLFVNYIGELGEERTNKANKILETVRNELNKDEEAHLKVITESLNEFGITLNQVIREDIARNSLNKATEVKISAELKEVEVKIEKDVETGGIRKETSNKPLKDKSNISVKTSPTDTVSDKTIQKTERIVETINKPNVKVTVLKGGTKTSVYNDNNTVNIMVPEGDVINLDEGLIVQNVSNEIITNTISNNINTNSEKIEETAKYTLKDKYLETVNTVIDKKVNLSFNKIYNIAKQFYKIINKGIELKNAVNYNVISDDRLIWDLLYDKNFVKNIVDSPELDINDVLNFLTMMTKIGDTFKSSDYSSVFKDIFFKNIELVQNNYKEAITNLLMNNSHIPIPTNIFTVDERREIINNRRQLNIAETLVNSNIGYNSLDDNAKRYLNVKIDNMFINSYSIMYEGKFYDKSKLTDMLYSVNGEKRRLLINIIDNYYGNKLFGDNRFMPNNTFGNRIFNMFLQNNNMTLNDFKNEDGTINKDIFNNVYSLFGKFTNNKMKLGLFNNKIIVINRVDSTSNIKAEYNKFNKDIDYGKDRKFILSTATNETVLIKYIANNDVKNLATVDDLIMNPELLSDDIKQGIKEKYKIINSINAYNYLRNYIPNVSKGTKGLAISENGKIVVVNTTLTSKLFNKDKLIVKQGSNISNLISNPSIKNLKRVQDCTIELINNGQTQATGKYDDKHNKIIVEGNTNFIANNDLNNNNELKFIITHELQHIIQMENNLNSGFVNNICKYMKLEQKDSLLNDFDNKYPNIFNKFKRKDGTFINKNSVYDYIGELIYSGTGEREANGVTEEYQTFPFIVNTFNNYTYLTTPWGTRYKLEGNLNPQYNTIQFPKSGDVECTDCTDEQIKLFNAFLIDNNTNFVDLMKQENLYRNSEALNLFRQIKKDSEKDLPDSNYRLKTWRKMLKEYITNYNNKNGTNIGYFSIKYSNEKKLFYIYQVEQNDNIVNTPVPKEIVKTEDVNINPIQPTTLQLGETVEPSKPVENIKKEVQENKNKVVENKITSLNEKENDVEVEKSAENVKPLKIDSENEENINAKYSKFLRGESTNKSNKFYVSKDLLKVHTELKSFEGEYLSKETGLFLQKANDAEIQDSVKKYINSGKMNFKIANNTLIDIIKNSKNFNENNKSKIKAENTFKLLMEAYHNDLYSEGIKSPKDLLYIYENFDDLFTLAEYFKRNDEDDKLNDEATKENYEEFLKNVDDIKYSNLSLKNNIKNAVDSEDAIIRKILVSYKGSLKDILKIGTSLLYAVGNNYNIPGKYNVTSIQERDESLGDSSKNIENVEETDVYDDLFEHYGKNVTDKQKQNIVDAYQLNNLIVAARTYQDFKNNPESAELKTFVKNTNTFFKDFSENEVEKLIKMTDGQYNKYMVKLYHTLGIKNVEDFRNFDVNKKYKIIVRKISDLLNKKELSKRNPTDIYSIDKGNIVKRSKYKVKKEIDSIINIINDNIKNKTYSADDILLIDNVLFVKNDNGQIKINPELYKDDISKGGTNNKYSTLEQMNKVYERLLTAKKGINTLKSTLLSEVKRLNKENKELKEKLVKSDKKITELKAKLTSKGFSYNIAPDVNLSSKSPIPDAVLPLYKDIDKGQVKNLHKHYGSEGSHKREAGYSTWVNENIEQLNNLTTQDIVGFSKFIEGFTPSNSNIESIDEYNRFISKSVNIAVSMLNQLDISGTSDLENAEHIRKVLNNFVEQYQSSAGRDIRNIGEYYRMLHPELIGQSYARNLGYKDDAFDDEDLKEMYKLISLGKFEELKELRHKMYTKALEKGKKENANLLDRLYTFERAGMLSSPHGIIRNFATNILLTAANIGVDNMVDKFFVDTTKKLDFAGKEIISGNNENFKKKKLAITVFSPQEGQYKITGIKVDPIYNQYYKSMFVDTGLQDLLESGTANRFDTRRFHIDNLSEDEKLQGLKAPNSRSSLTVPEFLNILNLDSINNQIGFSKNDDTTLFISTAKHKELDESVNNLLNKAKNHLTSNEIGRMIYLKDKISRYESEQSYKTVDLTFNEFLDGGSLKDNTKQYIDKVKNSASDMKALKEEHKKDLKEYKELEEKAISKMSAEEAKEYRLNKKLLKAFVETPNKVTKFIYKMLSDSPFVTSMTKYYFVRMSQETNLDVTKGLTLDALELYVKAFSQASQDYMHRSNFWNDIENVIRQKGGKMAYYGYKQLIPFASSSWNWFTESLKWTPAGLANSIKNIINYETYLDNMEKARQGGFKLSKDVMPRGLEQFNLKRDFGKGLVGSVTLGLGLLLAAAGLARIDDEDERVKLSIGDPDNPLYIDISNIEMSSGLMMGLGLVAQTKYAIKKGEDGFSAFLKAAKRTCEEAFIDDTFTNVISTIRASEKGTGAQQVMTVVNNSLNQLVPAAVKYASNLLILDKKNYGTGLNNVLNKNISNFIPLAAMAYDSLIDPYTGQIQYKYYGGAFGSAIVNFVNRTLPIKFYKYQFSETERLCRSLGVDKTQLTGRFTINEESYKLNTKDNTIYNKFYADLNKKELEPLINNKKKYKLLDEKTDKYKELYFKDMTDKEKATVLERVFSNNSSLAKIYILTSTDKFKFYCSADKRYELMKAGITKNIYVGNKEKFVKK